MPSHNPRLAQTSHRGNLADHYDTYTYTILVLPLKRIENEITEMAGIAGNPQTPCFRALGPYPHDLRQPPSEVIEREGTYYIAWTA